MAEIKLWAFSICAAGVAAALYRIAAPKGATYKTTMLVIELFLLLAIISPLTKLRWNDALKLPPIVIAEQGEEIAEDIAVLQIKENISRLVTEKLQAVGIIPRDIRIDITVSQDSFRLMGVEVWLDLADPQTAAQVKAELEQYLGIPVTVTVQDGVT